jgi:hypothetical protein
VDSAKVVNVWKYISVSLKLDGNIRDTLLLHRNTSFSDNFLIHVYKDRLCVLVVRVPGYRSRGPGFDSWRYQIFWEVVGMERSPLSLVRIMNGKVAAPGLENRDYGRWDPLRWPRDSLYQLKLALTSPTSCGSSVGIVRLRTKTRSSVHTRIYIYISKSLSTRENNFWNPPHRFFIEHSLWDSQVQWHNNKSRCRSVIWFSWNRSVHLRVSPRRYYSPNCMYVSCDTSLLYIF